MATRPKDIDLHDSVAGEEDPGASMDIEPDGAGAPNAPGERRSPPAAERERETKPLPEKPKR
jgi:hypothetical protein